MKRRQDKKFQDQDGCAACGHDRMWTIVGPDDIAFDQSWGDEEFVDDLVEYLNDAYGSGYDKGRDEEREAQETKP